MHRLKVGVVGLGMWGQNHALVYDDYERCELRVVCDLDEGRAKEYGDRYHCDWTTRVSELATGDVEAVSVATPDHTHFEPVRQLLSAGKAVMVEKPLCTDLKQAAILEAVSEISGAIAMVDFQNRWDPRHQLIKELVRSGELGQPTMGYIRLSDAIQVAESWLKWARNSGPQWFLLPHSLDIMRWIIGADPTQVYAVASKGVLASKGIDIIDSLQALVQFPGCFVTFETSWIVPDSQPSVVDSYMSLYGTKGKAEYDQDYQGLAISGERYTYPWVPVGRRDYFGKLTHHLYEPMRHFVDCVLDGKPVDCPIADGVVNTAVISAIERSISSGRPESVTDLLAAARSEAKREVTGG
jgi:predicted dehydrogenase